MELCARDSGFLKKNERKESKNRDTPGLPKDTQLETVLYRDGMGVKMATYD